MTNIIRTTRLGVKELTQLPGFPENALTRIRERAALAHPRSLGRGAWPRRLKQGHLEKTAKKPKGYT